MSSTTAFEAQSGSCCFLWCTYTTEDLSYFDPFFSSENKVQRENLLFHMLIMIYYLTYSQWYWFQHTYSNVHTITLTIRLSPKEAFSGKKKNLACSKDWEYLMICFQWYWVYIFENLKSISSNSIPRSWQLLICWQYLLHLQFHFLLDDHRRVYFHLRQHLVQLNLLQHNQNYWFFFSIASTWYSTKSERLSVVKTM